MKRWTIRIFLVLIGLALVGTAAVLLIVHTDLPQQLVLKALNEKLGMEVSAGSLRTSFWGKTTITDFTLGLPMENAPLLEIPEIYISHTSIPLILLKGFTIHEARIVNPVVNIKEDENGVWNIQEFAYQIQHVSSGQDKIKFRLPRLNIANGTCSVTDITGHVEKIAPIIFKGETQKRHVWNFEMDIASQITASGRIAQGSNWSHEVNIDINDLPDSIKNLVPQLTEHLIVKAGWKGRIRKNELVGRMQLEQARAGRIQVEGTLGIEVSHTGLIVNLDGLLVSGFEKPVEQFDILGGQVQFDGNQLRAEKILVNAAQNRASLSGKWRLHEKRGDFNCFLAGVKPGRNINYEGTIYGMIDLPAIGTKEIDLSINTQGKSPWGSWQSEADILGTGNNWASSQWKVNIPALTWKMQDRNIDAKDIKAQITANWPDIKLVSLDFANAEQLKAEGEFSADTNNWKISFAAEGFKTNEDQNEPLDLKIIAGGSLQSIAVEQFDVAYKYLHLEAAGDVSLPSKELSNAHAKASLALHSAPEPNESFANVSGNFVCETEITGSLWPTNLQLQAVLAGDDITMNKKVIEPVKIPWKAEIDTSSLRYSAEQFRLFDGTWNLNGSYDFTQKSSQFTLTTEQVSLQPVMGLFDLPLECSGQMGASLDVSLSMDDISQMVISGAWNVRDMVIPPVEAQRAEGRIKIQNGTAVFDEIILRQNQGTAHSNAWFRLDQPQFIYVEADAQKWPLQFPGQDMILVTDTNGTATLNLSNRTMKGKGSLSASVEINDKKFADVTTEIAVEERLLDLNDMTIAALGGIANGKITIPLDDWTNSKAIVDWQGIDTGELALFWPDCNGIEGKSSGSLTVAHTEDKRAFEPLQIDIQGKISNGSYRSTSLGGYDVSAYLGRKRLLIDKAEINTMSGTIKSSGSISQHSDGYSTYVNADFSQIELNQLVHLFLPGAKPVLGKLTGKGVLVVVSDLHGLTGEVNFDITESDLARTMIISTLYNVMNLKFGNNEPKGQGQVSLRFEGSSLQIPSFVYFNRGVEIRGGGSIDDLTKGRMSSVRGYAVGSARPLKGINLLGIKELDRLMASLQTNVASVKIQGTLDKPEAVSVPFKEISTGLRALLWDQLHK